MPSYMPTHMPRVGRLPLTPPEIWGQYPNSAGPTGGYCSTGPGFYPVGNNDSRFAQDPQDPRYGYGKPVPMQTEQYHELPQVPASNYSGNTRHDYAYGAIGAPILPPIRIPEHAMDKQTQRQSQSVSRNDVQEQPKEEKVAGGVAAHLDYEMEQMIDFVAESAQGMYDLFKARFCLADIDISRSVQSSPVVTSELRKYVSSILTSTRLPSSTILLALYYLANRMSALQAKSVYTSSNSFLYRILTVALMLASKFLDDNTFQNRSWAEVSRIPVGELNKMEREWLEDLTWILHFDVNDRHGFAGWLQQWDCYRAKKVEMLKNVEMSMKGMKLSPIDPAPMNYPAPKYGPQTPLYTPPYTETSFSSAFSDRNQSWQQWPRALSPHSAGHSGPTTPEWYKQNMMGYNQHAIGYSNRPLPPMHILPSNDTSRYGGYYQQYTHSPWNGHGAGCGCAYCALSHERYHLAPGYGMQTVVG